MEYWDVGLATHADGFILTQDDPAVQLWRACSLGKVLRKAKPDDVFTLVRLRRAEK